jgi:hypothetical protein
MEAKPFGESINTLHHAHNQYPPGFPPLDKNHGLSVHPTPSPTYQAPTQALTSVSQSVEDTFKVFMKMTRQSISEVRNETIVNTQAIVKL